jgi:hypothetical protein
VGSCCQSGAPSLFLTRLVPLHSSCRWLWGVFARPKWSPTTHRQHAEAFRHAVRAFLLAAHRSASGGQRRQGAGAALGQMPHELLLQVVGAAAGPASASLDVNAWLRRRCCAVQPVHAAAGWAPHPSCSAVCTSLTIRSLVPLMFSFQTASCEPCESCPGNARAIHDLVAVWRRVNGGCAARQRAPQGGSGRPSLAGRLPEIAGGAVSGAFRSLYKPPCCRACRARRVRRVRRARRARRACWPVPGQRPFHPPVQNPAAEHHLFSFPSVWLSLWPRYSSQTGRLTQPRSAACSPRIRGFASSR